MSRVNKFQEGHGPIIESRYMPARKRKNRTKGFRLAIERKYDLHSKVDGKNARKQR